MEGEKKDGEWSRKGNEEERGGFVKIGNMKGEKERDQGREGGGAERREGGVGRIRRRNIIQFWSV